MFYHVALRRWHLFKCIKVRLKSCAQVTKMRYHHTPSSARIHCTFTVLAAPSSEQELGDVVMILVVGHDILKHTARRGVLPALIDWSRRPRTRVVLCNVVQNAEQLRVPRNTFFLRLLNGVSQRRHMDRGFAQFLIRIVQRGNSNCSPPSRAEPGKVSHAS